MITKSMINFGISLFILLGCLPNGNARSVSGGKCDISTARVMSIFKRGFAYIAPDTNLSENLYYQPLSLAHELDAQFEGCRIDMNLVYHAMIHDKCLSPKCISVALKRSHY